MPAPNLRAIQDTTPIIEQVVAPMFRLNIEDCGAGTANLHYILPNGKCYTFPCAAETIASLRLSLAKVGAVTDDTASPDPA